MKAAPFSLRFVLCGIIAFFNGVQVSFQGNGNFILAGFCIGLALGLAWSILLLFAVPRWARKFRPSLVSWLGGVALLAALTLIAVVSVKLWGDLVFVI